MNTPVVGTVTPAATIPAACEGGLRDLARDLRDLSTDDMAERLLRIVARYSGVKPLRGGQ